MTPTNEKLRRRAVTIVASIFAVSEDDAAERLEAAGWDLQAALKT
jgi:N-acetylmuramic acid 6-phosphate (MurNAc-6-P) etherase